MKKVFVLTRGQAMNDVDVSVWCDGVFPELSLALSKVGQPLHEVTMTFIKNGNIHLEWGNGAVVIDEVVIDDASIKDTGDTPVGVMSAISIINKEEAKV